VVHPLLKADPDAQAVHNPINTDELKQQQREALQAVREREPKPTEGFTSRFVNAIRAIIDGVVNVVMHIVQKLGLAS
jgi:hypothetical protein